MLNGHSNDTKGYRLDSYTERALAHLENDIGYLSRHCTGYGMPPEDIRQELRLQIFRKIHLYDPRKYALRTWAKRVMRNRLTDMNRYVTRPNRVPLDKIISYEFEEWLHHLAAQQEESYD